MILNISSSDPNLLVDEYGEPMFRFVGLHPSDVTTLISELNEVDRLREENEELNETVKELEYELQNATETLDQIQALL